MALLDVDGDRVAVAAASLGGGVHAVRADVRDREGMAHAVSGVAESFGRLELAAHGATAGVAYFGVVETEMTAVAMDRGRSPRAGGMR